MQNQNVIAFDLATKTGWAVRLRDGTVHHGVIDIKGKPGAHPGLRWQQFRAQVVELMRKYDVHVVAFEQIDHFAPMRTARGQASIPSAAIIIIAGCRAHLESICSANNLPLLGFHIGTIKKHWTGAGNAKKAQMMEEARRRGYDPKDDNAADALAILSLALSEASVAI